MVSGASAQVLESREKGQFPISIGTSLALEGAFGIHPDNAPNEGKAVKQPQVSLTLYNEFWFNIRTLFRNMYGAIKKDEIVLSPRDYAIAIYEEMVVIRSALQQQTGNRVVPVYYVCDYNNLTNLLKHAQFKEVKTPKQKEYAALENKTLEILAEILKEQGTSFYHFDTTINGHDKSALFVTHYPLDLLANRNFNLIALLESHTGIIKPKALWYTKLNNGKNLTRIPFDIMTIQVFGDSGGLFSPFPQDVRQALLDLSEKYKWTPVTTKERIKMCAQIARMPALEGLMMKLYTNLV